VCARCDDELTIEEGRGTTAAQDRTP
jgi:hypothetical protein